MGMGIDIDYIQHWIEKQQTYAIYPGLFHTILDG